MKNTKIKLSNQKIAVDQYGFFSIYDEKQGLIFRESYQNLTVLYKYHPSNGYNTPWAEIIFRGPQGNRLTYNEVRVSLITKTYSMPYMGQNGKVKK